MWLSYEKRVVSELVVLVEGVLVPFPVGVASVVG